MRTSKFTAIDFFDELTSTYARKRFVAGLGIVTLVSLLLILLVQTCFTSQTPKDIATTILIEILAGTVLVFLFYLYYVKFVGFKISDRDIHVTRSEDIQQIVRSLPSDARTYRFWGRSGSYFRAYTLREIDAITKRTKRNVRIEVLLPDPLDTRLISSYREILESLGENDGENPLLPHVLATCIACAVLSANNRYLEINIFLSSFLPAFRLDLTDRCGILTQDDKRKSALYFESPSEFFDMFENTMINERKVSKEVNWEADSFRNLEFGDDSISRARLEAFGIAIDNLRDVQDRIRILLTKFPHRYK